MTYFITTNIHMKHCSCSYHTLRTSTLGNAPTSNNNTLSLVTPLVGTHYRRSTMTHGTCALTFTGSLTKNIHSSFSRSSHDVKYVNECKCFPYTVHISYAVSVVVMLSRFLMIRFQANVFEDVISKLPDIVVLGSIMAGIFYHRASTSWNYTHIYFMNCLVR